MRRTNIYLTEEQQKRLGRRARAESLSKSALIRRILDEALAIAPDAVSTEEAIRVTSAIWADRNELDLQDVLRWRREEPLGRLSS